MNLAEPADIVMSGSTAAVLRTLAGARRPFSIRELARLGGISSRRAQVVVGWLRERGLITVEPAGRAQMCTLNREHLAADAVIALVTLRARMVDALAEELSQWGTPPLHASLFGSAARGDGSIDSDIDVLVIRPDTAIDGDWSDQCYDTGERLRAQTGNHVSWFELTHEELGDAAAAQEPILRSWVEEGILLTGEPLRRLVAALATSPG